MPTKNELKNLYIRAKYVVKELLDNDPQMIVPYLSYANKDTIKICGRVIENEGIIIKEDDGFVTNFINNVRRFETDELYGARIIIRYKELEFVTETDKEGYFDLNIDADVQTIIQGDIVWEHADIFLPDFLDQDGKPIRAKCRIMLLHEESKFGIITDIDDTILKSHVDSFLKLKTVYQTFFKNHFTRVAFDGISDVLNKLSRWNSVDHINPLFYLSHSPWNLYDVLHQFLHENNIPDGPFFLRDFGIKSGKAKHEYKNHKILTINHLLNFYTEIPFILIGDATEHDIDIYMEAYQKFPQKILYIFIRASQKNKKNNRITHIIDTHPDIPIQLIFNSEEIIEKMNKINF